MDGSDGVEGETVFIGPTEKVECVSVVGFAGLLISDAGGEKFLESVGGFFAGATD